MTNDVIPFLISAFGFAAAPALLQILAAIVGWLKRPSGLPVGRQSQRHRETSPLTDLRISVKQAAEVPSAPPGTPIAEVRDEAERINERVRRVHIVAMLVSAAVVSSLFLVFTSRTFVPSIRVGLAYAFLAPQLLILFWVIRLPMRRRLLIFLAHIVAGVVLLLLFTPRGFVWWVVAWQYIKVALIPVPGMLILF
ncbi:MAG TPA: hypothetical protein VFV49_01705, partial [Thermoanaerobaculia bacterium]|nr:hypothetical protein [Thermoanaerobaculia bacterium]